MRRTAGLALVLLLTGCTGEPETAGPQTTTSQQSQGPSEAERQFLSDARSSSLLGDYLDEDLLAVGHSICDNRSQGADPLADARSDGSGSYVFDDPGVTVFAVDTISIDFSAQDFLCPDV